MNNHSVRTGMEAVYTLLNVDRAVPEVWGSVYDIRELLRATYYALDKVKLLDSDALNSFEKAAIKTAYNKIKDTDVGELLRDSKLF